MQILSDVSQESKLGTCPGNLQPQSHQGNRTVTQRHILPPTNQSNHSAPHGDKKGTSANSCLSRILKRWTSALSRTAKRSKQLSLYPDNILQSKFPWRFFCKFPKKHHPPPTFPHWGNNRLLQHTCGLSCFFQSCSHMRIWTTKFTQTLKQNSSAFDWFIAGVQALQNTPQN